MSAPPTTTNATRSSDFITPNKPTMIGSASPSSSSRGRRAVDASRDEYTLVIDNGKAKMQCNHCGKVITNHTATLKNHLARRHNGPPTNTTSNGSAAKRESIDGNSSATTAGRTKPIDSLSSSSTAIAAPVASVPTTEIAVIAPPPSAIDDASVEHKRRRLDVHVLATGSSSNAPIDTITNNNSSMLHATNSVVAPVDVPQLPLIDRQDFIDMNREMHEQDEMREQIIKRSREILKSSKQAIFALHRADIAGATALLTAAERVIPELVVLASVSPALRDGALAAALEEYVEAKAFAFFLSHRRLLPLRDVPDVQRTEYIGGIVDLTGELMRYAVVQATARDVGAVERCRAIVAAIAGELLQFDFRNGPLRKKCDAVKYNLRKLENTLYELSLITQTGLAITSSAVRDDPSSSNHNDDSTGGVDL